MKLDDMGFEVEKEPLNQAAPTLENDSLNETAPALEKEPLSEGAPAPEKEPLSEGAPAPEKEPLNEATPAPEKNPEKEEGSTPGTEFKNAGMPQYAGFFPRLAAYLVDVILVGIIQLVLIRVPVWIFQLTLLFSKAEVGSNFFTKDIIFKWSMQDLTLVLILVFYFVLFTHFKGYTPGKYLFRLRVVDREGNRLSFWNVVYRETVGRFLSQLVLNIGYIMVGFGKEKMGLHDYLCDSRVIYR